MNFSAIFLSLAFLHSALVPTSSTQFFVTPEVASVITFYEKSDASASKTLKPETISRDFVLRDVKGKEIRHIQANVVSEPEKTGEKSGVSYRYSVNVSLPQGYFELFYPATDQVFGVVSLSAFCDNEKENLQKIADPFFAIDGAMSWLIRGPEFDRIRDEYAQIARRSGVGMIRDRLRWGDCQKEAGLENLNIESARHYDSCRKSCQRHGVLVLELCHDAPAWMPRTAEKYPKDLLTVRRVWDIFTPAWNRAWGGMEVWNEPEISFGGNLPADQYVPLLKTIAYQQQNSPAEKSKESETGERTPLVGGVMATCLRSWLDTAAESGVLEACDVFSFHTYAKAPAVEILYGRFQEWLRQYGHPAKPLWLTECGRPWILGPGRPPMEEDLVSAIDITMKGVEAKAFGIQRYFPFVFPYYEERMNNFGMFSKDHTPLRSFAAYAQSVRVLAHREYLGDLNFPLDGWLRARVFSAAEKGDRIGKSDCVAVIYAPEVKSRKIQLPAECPILHAERITGEVIPIDKKSNSLENCDGFVYLWLAADKVSGFLNTETVMNQMRKERLGNTHAQTKMTKRSPIVLRYELDEKNVQWNPGGYELSTTCEEEVILKITATNLSENDVTIPVTCRALCEGAKVAGPEKIDISASGTTDFEVKVIPGSEYRKMMKYCPIEITAEDRIVVKIQPKFTMDQIQKVVSHVEKIRIRELENWKPNMPTCCDELRFAQTGDTWTMMAHFTEGDHWVYPFFMLPENVNLKDFDGIILRARCWDFNKKTEVRFFAYQPGGAFFTSEKILPTDGEWHVVQIPFSSLVLCSAAGGTEAVFKPEEVRKISIGGNTKNDSLQIEVSDLFFYQK
ncbi:MAG: hypothetical protein Q4D17_05540 [Planctomycetia bacterium]|nr:hypothetical protein [Planctomycetia bacterium]